jgi:transcriptional regulator with XRE-family HTH domain
LEKKRTLQNINNFINALSNIEKNSSIILKSIIKEEREKQKLSLSELARRCGHAVSTLHAIENGRNNNPSYRTIADICAALNLSMDEMEQRIQKNKSDKF